MFGFLLMAASVYILFTKQPGDIEAAISGWSLMILSYIETNHSIVTKRLKEIKNGKTES